MGKRPGVASQILLLFSARDFGVIPLAVNMRGMEVQRSWKFM